MLPPTNANPKGGADVETTLNQARHLLRDANCIAVFTGAGVSAESGIPTFRDAGGLWARFPPEQFAHWQGIEGMIKRNPLLLATFVVELLRPIVAASPNPAHDSIASLEKRKAVIGVVTQNIDGLHQRAGSAHVIEIHGSLLETVHVGWFQSNVRQVTLEALASTIQELEVLLKTGQSDPVQFMVAARALFGKEGAESYRPNIVLFGDKLPEAARNQAVRVVSKCDVLLIVGTSHLVYPAASLPSLARSAGAKIICVGLDPCPCELWLHGRAGELLPLLVNGL